MLKKNWTKNSNLIVKMSTMLVFRKFWFLFYVEIKYQFFFLNSFSNQKIPSVFSLEKTHYLFFLLLALEALRTLLVLQTSQNHFGFFVRLKVALCQKVLQDFQIAQKMCRKLSWAIKILNMAMKKLLITIFFAFAGLICLQVLQIGFRAISLRFDIWSILYI